MKQYPEPFQSLLQARPVSYTPRTLRVQSGIQGVPSDERWRRAVDHMSVMGFRLTDTTDPNVVDVKRESMLGNLFSFDVRKLITSGQLLRTMDEIVLDLQVSLVGQLLTTWNYIDLQVELHEFNQYVETGESLPQLWVDLARARGPGRRLDWIPAQLYWRDPSSSNREA